MIFSELYTRAISIMRTLSRCEVNSKILDSTELAELLYVAYNRDESEVLNLRKALNAGYDAFYVTAPDILEKKKRKIEKEVEDEAIELATASLLEADRIRMLESSKKQKVKDRANEIVDSYRESMDKDLYEETKRQIEKSDEDEEEVREEKKKRGRKKKNS